MENTAPVNSGPEIGPVPIEIRRLTVAEMPAVHDLRWRVLRPGRTPESTRFAEDEWPGTIHMGAFQVELSSSGRSGAGALAGIATLVENRGLQLRGMAVEPGVRGTGVGAALLRATHDVAAARNVPLWCNARKSAMGFYSKLGWQVEGGEFDVPEVGPHYVMRYSAPTR